ncbi:hypothetical protein, partial [Pseudomonas sp. AM4(2022)]|uniref:hypothetical protein n=1 Tax=Pseudomonas sp. AM4(2022) TaxID=2983408 RepID=UPI002E810E48
GVAGVGAFDHRCTGVFVVDFIPTQHGNTPSWYSKNKCFCRLQGIEILRVVWSVNTGAAHYVVV